MTELKHEPLPIEIEEALEALKQFMIDNHYNYATIRGLTILRQTDDNTETT